MAFSHGSTQRDFSISKVKQKFNLTLVEGKRFLTEIESVLPSSYLAEFLEESIPLAIAMGSEKARSELIISPILFELRKLLNREISFFSGEEFNVDATVGLTGFCDFLISLSPEQLFIEAPAIVIIEAKKENLKGGLGQCIASMIAAQKFNAENNKSISTVYGSVTSGNLWSFLKLENTTITIDLTEYLIPPVEQLLGILVWMVRSGLD
ncbi:MAG: hypothetical protein HC836_07735 [Richelia sp. RM2_1_2]|nr:hypothetical protein [Richelia sp. SM2_1_7]NJN07354.1 hypothetical protein [Richelia sp. RM1_1_1]NJO29705.1 hypothetical protein [Richelia sp. SL_2_1]NJO58245.1 hypothetical protein [Richelia sp. RM2_1_2]